MDFFLSGKDLKMQFSRFTFICVVLTAAAIIMSGCISQEKYDDLKLRNRSQQQRIDELESQLNVTKLKLAQTEKQLAELQEAGGADAEAMKKKIEALQKDIDEKTALIAKMQTELVNGRAVLSPELSSALRKFAEANSDISNNLEIFKSDPYGQAWLIKIKASDKKELDSLMDAEAYEKQLEGH